MSTSKRSSESAEALFLAFDEGQAHANKRPKTTETKLSWRLPSEESHSDSTIVLTNESDKAEKKTFHVHKGVLSVKSDYFASMFRSSSSFKESESSTSSISIPELAFRAFPLMLDFCYGEDLADEVSAENLVALRYLSHYFSIRMLFDNVSRKILSALLFPDKAVTLMTAADEFQDEKLVALVRDRWALECDLIPMGRLPPPLALQMFEADEQAMNDNLYISMVVAQYCMERRNEIDAGFLVRATKHAQVVRTSVAPFLLGLSLELGGDKSEQMDRLQKLCREAFQKRRDEWFEDAEDLFRDKPPDEATTGPEEPPQFYDWVRNYRALGDSERAAMMESIASVIWDEYKAKKEQHIKEESDNQKLKRELRRVKQENRRLDAEKEKSRIENRRLKLSAK